MKRQVSLFLVVQDNIRSVLTGGCGKYNDETRGAVSECMPAAANPHLEGERVSSYGRTMESNTYYCSNQMYSQYNVTLKKMKRVSRS